VGDKVKYEKEGGEAMIVDLLPRKNYLIRKSIKLSKQVQILAANIDQLFLMVTFQHPQTTKGFVDRFLVGAEAYRVPVILLYHKSDERKSRFQEVLEDWKLTYDLAGYEQYESSIHDESSLTLLKNLMKDKVSIFAGHSGVGKSSLINALNPELDLRVNEISEYHGAGQHTTTFAEMFELEAGAKIIDTPGIKGFGNVRMEKEELAHYFPEMRIRMNNCKYHNCVHISEPDCAVKSALAEGEIAESRYFNYLAMYEEDEEESYRQKGY
jgi:ribosome biogenesis GTPase